MWSDICGDHVGDKQGELSDGTHHFSELLSS